LQFAAKFPERVEKLVIEDIGPDGDPSAPDYYRWLFSIIPTPFATKLQAKEFFMNEFKTLAKNRTQNPDTLGQYLYSNLIETEGGQVDWRFSKEAMIMVVVQGRAKERWNELRALPMPTLVIRGANSKELSHEVFRQMTFANPRVEGVEIPNAGHWVHSDQPEEFLRVIRKFTDLPS
jgi:pimeloyl-ACP methyl ester carboxylesterase